jgi:hypothetical protein
MKGISKLWQQITGFINFKTGAAYDDYYAWKGNDPNFMDMTRVVEVIETDTVEDNFWTFIYLIFSILQVLNHIGTLSWCSRYVQWMWKGMF